MSSQFIYITSAAAGAIMTVTSNPPTVAYQVVVSAIGNSAPPPPPYDSCSMLPFPPFTLIGTYSFEVFVANACDPKSRKCKNPVDALPPPVISKQGNLLQVTFSGANPGETVLIGLMDGGGENPTTTKPQTTGSTVSKGSSETSGTGGKKIRQRM